MKVVLLSIFVFASLLAQAQGATDQHKVTISIPSVAILDLESASSKDLTASFTAPSEPGLPIVAPADLASIWLNYTSVILPTNAVRKVSVNISAGALTGIVLKVSAGAASTTLGKGTLGTGLSAITLSSTAADIVTGIGSTYTGDGVSAGHLLTYNLTLDDTAVANLRQGSQEVTVLYTMSGD